MSAPLDLGAPTALRLLRVAVPLRTPHVWAGGSTAVRDVVLVAWTRPDGTVGWGECPTLEGYATGGTDAAWSAAVALAPRLRRGEVRLGPAGEWHDPAGAVVPVAVRGAVADAALDAALRAEGRTLVAHLGGPGGPVERGAVVARPGASVDELVRAAVDAVASGATLVKLKVGPSTRPEDVAAVRDAVAPVPVAADANGTLDMTTAQALDGLGLAYLEDPVPVTGGDWTGLAATVARFATPVAVDEPVTSSSDVDRLLGEVDGAAGLVVSVKPCRLGGLWAAADVARRVVAGGGRCVVGGMVELGVHRAGAVALASAVGALPGTFPTDLGPSSRYVAVDVAGPVVTDVDGRLVVPAGPGTGVVPDPDVLAAVTLDEVRVD